MTLTAYLSSLSATAGSSIDCMVSSTHGEVALDVVRLLHGDCNPAGPGSKMSAVPEIPTVRVAGGEREVGIGSCVVVPHIGSQPLRELRIDVVIKPTLPRAGRPQGIISLVDESQRAVLELFIDENAAITVRDSASDQPVCSLTVDWTAADWYRLRLEADSAGHTELSCETVRPPGDHVISTVHVRGRISGAHAAHSAVIGAMSCIRQQGQWRPAKCFNGKIENPRIYRTNAGACVPIADWRFERSLSSTQCEDATPHGFHGIVVNAPTRAATGVQWRGKIVDFTKAPEQYGAIHFHEDDLDDAGWPVSATIGLPSSLSSGVYAVRLVAGDDEDLVPFAVLPAECGNHARVAVLLPTFTYVAYGNERMIDRLDFEGDSQTDHPVEPGFYDRELARHPEWGLSLYDLHSDGSACVHSTHLRPIPNLRPSYRSWLQNAPRHLSADLYLVDWLTEQRREFDVITDHDLSEQGARLLEPYDLVITGSHPEYVSETMLDALESHTAAGGALMYLGGNGFYWVTSQDPFRSHLIEVRRGAAGTRPSECAPGEGTHSTTGEPGGLWRSRGRWPNHLTGVGMTAQGWDHKAPGYRRMPDSFLPQARFAFEGIADDEIIGDFGLIMDGAAGDEIDRFDVEKGSPEHALLLARTTGHSDFYQLAGEDVLASRPGLGGTECEGVRSDIVLFQTDGGGAVFSAGSICFSGSLSYNGYDNNVSKLVSNVIQEFLRAPRRKQSGPSRHEA